MGKTGEGGGCWARFKGTNWLRWRSWEGFFRGSCWYAPSLIHPAFMKEGKWVTPLTSSQTIAAACKGVAQRLTYVPCRLCVCMPVCMCEREKGTDEWHRPQNLRPWGCDSWPEAAEQRRAHSTPRGHETSHSSRCKDAWTETCRFLLNQIRTIQERSSLQPFKILPKRTVSRGHIAQKRWGGLQDAQQVRGEQ